MIISHGGGEKKSQQMMVCRIQEIEELRVCAVNF